MSPLNLRPSFKVATSSFVPPGFGIQYEFCSRTQEQPSTPGLTVTSNRNAVVTLLPYTDFTVSYPFAPVAVIVSTLRFLQFHTVIVTVTVLRDP